jgi:hypothetical protein
MAECSFHESFGLRKTSQESIHWEVLRVKPGPEKQREITTILPAPPGADGEAESITFNLNLWKLPIFAHG